MTMGLNTPRLVPSITARDHLQGYPDAELTLVLYGDYESSLCSRARSIIRSVQRRLGHQLLFVFRNFPLRALHPHAEIAAEIAESAALEGKFWQMHDLLFERQHALEPEHLLHYAAALELDTSRVAAELAGGLHEQRVRDDFMSGVRSGVNGAPAFFVNGIRYSDVWDEEHLMGALLQFAPHSVSHAP